MSFNRFLSSVFLIGAAACAVVFHWGTFLVVIALTVGGLYEFFSMIKKKGIPIYSYTGILIGAMIPISVFFHFELNRNWEFLFTVLAFLLILMLQFIRKDNTNAVVGISTTMFGVFYVAWLLSFLIKIKFLLPGAAGLKLVAFILLVTKSGDIGALLIGSWIGKHPLFPRISPNKSIEGGVGSLIFSMAVAVLCRDFLPARLDFAVWQILLMGAFFGGIGQLGDLSESLIKRDCNIKDSGKFLPGVGGVLDIIDSLLFSGPAFYLFMSAMLNLG